MGSFLTPEFFTLRGSLYKQICLAPYLARGEGNALVRYQLGGLGIFGIILLYRKVNTRSVRWPGWKVQCGRVHHPRLYFVDGLLQNNSIIFGGNEKNISMSILNLKIIPVS